MFNQINLEIVSCIGAALAAAGIYQHRLLAHARRQIKQLKVEADVTLVQVAKMRDRIKYAKVTYKHLGHHLAAPYMGQKNTEEHRELFFISYAYIELLNLDQNQELSYEYRGIVKKAYELVKKYGLYETTNYRMLAMFLLQIAHALTIDREYHREKNGSDLVLLEVPFAAVMEAQREAQSAVQQAVRGAQATQKRAGDGKSGLQVSLA